VHLAPVRSLKAILRAAYGRFQDSFPHPLTIAEKLVGEEWGWKDC